jgi:von Willebrand factor type A domain
MAQCPNGHEVEDGAIYCPACGAQISGRRQCPNGHDVAGGASFCSVCGVRMTPRWLRWPSTLGSKIGATLGVLAALIGVTLGVRQVLAWLFPPPSVSAVFVLDTSASMKSRFGKTTKLQAAINEILDLVAAYPNMAASLRLSGGICTHEYQDPILRFHTHATDNFTSHLTNLQAGRKSDYIHALEYAANDFLTGDAAQSKAQLIYVFVGSPQESCSGIDAIQLPTNTSAVKFSFFGLGASQHSFDAVKKDLSELGISVHTLAAKNTGELKRMVKHVAGDQISPTIPPVPITTDTLPTDTTPTDTLPTDTLPTDTTPTDTTPTDTTPTDTTPTDTTPTDTTPTDTTPTDSP